MFSSAKVAMLGAKKRAAPEDAAPKFDIMLRVKLQPRRQDRLCDGSDDGQLALRQRHQTTEALAVLGRRCRWTHHPSSIR